MEKQIRQLETEEKLIAKEEKKLVLELFAYKSYSKANKNAVKYDTKQKPDKSFKLMETTNQKKIFKC